MTYVGIGVVHDMEESVDGFVEVGVGDFLEELLSFSPALVVGREEDFNDRVKLVIHELFNFYRMARNLSSISNASPCNRHSGAIYYFKIIERQPSSYTMIYIWTYHK
jgi:hypothetical protein